VAKARGRGHRRIAAALGRVASTVRGWLRRFGVRAGAIREHFTRWAYALDPSHDRLWPGSSTFCDAVEAIGVAGVVAVRRFGPPPGVVAGVSADGRPAAVQHELTLPPARQRQFKIANPPSQKFSKTDLAKFVNTWDQRPQMVSLGAEKNFFDFMSHVDTHRQDLDPERFHRLIAKGILYRAATQVARRRQSGYYAQNVGYTLSKLYHATRQRIDLPEGWRHQRPSEATLLAIEELSDLVQELIVHPVGRYTHIGEWCKKTECWKVVSELRWRVPPALEKELLGFRVA
jgi:hypothetical protein